VTGGVTELVDRGGLENRCTLAGTVGSNPTPTAMVPRGDRDPVVHRAMVVMC
jgi:hypothetical protein